MEQDNWKLVRREKNSNQEIEKIIEEKIEEKKPEILPQHKREFIEFLFKGISAFAIVIPLILFYIQYRNENIRRQNESLTQIYLDVTFDIATVLNSSPATDKFAQAKDRLLYLDPSKISIFKNDKLNTSFSEITFALEYYTELNKIKNLHDTIYSYYSSIFRYFSILKKGDEVEKIEFYQKSESDVLNILLKCLPLLSQYQNLIQSYPYEYFQKIDTIYSSDSIINQTSKEVIKMLEKKTDMQNKLGFLDAYLTSGDKTNLKYISINEMDELNRLNNYLIGLLNRFKFIIDSKRKDFQNHILENINN